MDGQIEGLDVFSPLQASFLRWLALRQQKEQEKELEGTGTGTGTGAEE